MALKIPSPPAGFPTTESVTCVPRLFVPLSVWQKLHAYVGACPVEINGFGLLEPHGFDLMVTESQIKSTTAEILAKIGEQLKINKDAKNTKKIVTIFKFKC
jgi:hypothetical protein